MSAMGCRTAAGRVQEGHDGEHSSDTYTADLTDCDLGAVLLLSVYPAPRVILGGINGRQAPCR